MAFSTTEVEYMIVMETRKETIWLLNLLNDLVSFTNIYMFVEIVKVALSWHRIEYIIHGWNILAFDFTSLEEQDENDICWRKINITYNIANMVD